MTPLIVDLAGALSELRAGRAVVVPTDTVYGLAADPTNAGAVEELFTLKGRPSDVPIPLLVDSIGSARACAAVWPRAAGCLADVFWPGPLTLVVEAAVGTHPYLVAGGSTVGVRQPDHGLVLELLRAFGGPLACTSANLSGSPPALRVAELPGRFLEAGVSVVDGGDLEEREASTVVAVSDNVGVRVLRAGPITQMQVEHVVARCGG